jgi:hypothetical protein
MNRRNNKGRGKKEIPLPDLLELQLVKPTPYDFLIASLIASIGCIYISTANLTLVPNTLILLSFVALGSTVIDSTYTTSLDRSANKVSVTKTRLGWLVWKRVAPLDEVKGVCSWLFTPLTLL